MPLPRPFLALALALALLSGCRAGNGASPLSPGYTDAVELKLKGRELADQMLATMPNDAIQGFVAMPTSFVDMNNTQRSSPLGRLLAESMFYEFNQRGFPTREYRLTGRIAVQGGRDDLALAANQMVGTGQQWAALLVGTYHKDADATFVNVRLVRCKDGLVLRTGQLVLVNTPIVERMIKADAPLPPPPPKTPPRPSGRAGAGGNDGGVLRGLYAPVSSISTGSMRIRQGR